MEECFVSVPCLCLAHCRAHNLHCVSIIGLLFRHQSRLFIPCQDTSCLVEAFLKTSSSSLQMLGAVYRGAQRFVTGYLTGLPYPHIDFCTGITSFTNPSGDDSLVIILRHVMQSVTVTAFAPRPTSPPVVHSEFSKKEFSNSAQLDPTRGF